MTISQSNGAAPVFCKKNWINKDSSRYGTFTASTMQSLLARIIDGDPLSYWQDGTGSDLPTETITVSLMEGGTQTSRSIDLMIFQNINWKNFLVEYSNDNGGSWATLTGGDYRSGTADLANGTTDLVLNPTPVTANLLRVSIYKTQTANQNKTLGGWIATQVVLQPTGAFEQYEPTTDDNVREADLGNKNISTEFILRSAQEYRWFRAAIGFSLMPTSEMETLETIKTGREAFILWVEPYESKRSVYLCIFRGGWAKRYTSTYKGAGWNWATNVREVQR